MFNNLIQCKITFFNQQICFRKSMFIVITARESVWTSYRYVKSKKLIVYIVIKINESCVISLTSHSQPFGIILCILCKNCTFFVIFMGWFDHFIRIIMWYMCITPNSYVVVYILHYFVCLGSLCIYAFQFVNTNSIYNISIKINKHCDFHNTEIKYSETHAWTIILHNTMWFIFMWQRKYENLNSRYNNTPNSIMYDDSFFFSVTCCLNLMQ